MSVEKQLIKLDNLIELSNLLLENGDSSNDMTLFLHVVTQELLKRIYEVIYYRYQIDYDSPINEDVEEINVNINDIKFKYIKDQYYDV